jgi:hypothetical protein
VETTAPLHAPLTWRRSSKCAESSCVEVALAGNLVAVRDTKTPDGTPLSYTKGEWAAFIAGVKAGEFDDFAFGD